MPEQQAYAEQQVKKYLAAVKKHQNASCYPPRYFGGNAQADKKAARRLLQRAAATPSGSAFAIVLFDGIRYSNRAICRGRVLRRCYACFPLK